jgi:hypothetical protein
MGKLQTIGGNNLFVSNGGDEAIDGVYIRQKTLINNRGWYVKDNPSPILDFAIAWDSSINFWVLYVIGLPITVSISNSSSNNPWETTWDNSMIVNQTTLTNNKISIKKQNLTVSGYSIALINGVYKLQNTLINGRNWYLHDSLLFNVRWNNSTSRWNLLSNQGVDLSVATNSTDNPWEATWSNNVQVSLGSGGKLNLNN